MQRMTLVCLASMLMPLCSGGDQPWAMHVIDASSQGADGVRLGDVDKDGIVDIVTGWEEGGQIRVCFGPDTAVVKDHWLSICVGRVGSPEDAVFADINQDGWPDVVSCSEGKVQTVWVHISPGMSLDRVRNPALWTTRSLSGTRGVTRWMFCLPLDGRRLILGSKDPGGGIYLYRIGADSSSRLAKLRTCGWIMSLRGVDMDGDGDTDILYSDRKGPDRGVGWLEQNSDETFADHSIGGHDHEVMFLDVLPAGPRGKNLHQDVERRGRAGKRPATTTICCQTRRDGILIFRPRRDFRTPWKQTLVRLSGRLPFQTGGGKGIAVGDLNQDGWMDIACTCEGAAGVTGVFWLKSLGPDLAGISPFTAHDISGADRGVKFDRIELLDLNADGAIDLLTCEERDNLGVIWYENPGGRSDRPSRR